MELAQTLARGLGLGRISQRGLARLINATFMFFTGFLTLGLLAALAMVSGTPMIFPSLGPTAFLFFARPLAPVSSPRNALLGHALGLLCGYGTLWLTGLLDAPSAMSEGVNCPRLLATSLSLAATGALMVLCRVTHPPAGATTLIVSLGIITSPFHLLIIEVAVGLLALLAIGINRLMGIGYPLWARRPRSASAPPAAGSPGDP